jgi:hypothetical protein
MGGVVVLRENWEAEREREDRKRERKREREKRDFRRW